MYGGKQIRAGDTIYIFAGEHEGGHGLIARGIVIAADAHELVAGVARQTPRVNKIVGISQTAGAFLEACFRP